MTDLSRRSFLRGTLAVAAACVSKPVAALLPSYPILHGDAIHDDAPALRALLNGEPVLCEGKVITSNARGRIVLRSGQYLLGSPVSVTRTVHMSGSTFVASETFSGGPMLNVDAKGEYVHISDCTFEGNKKTECAVRALEVNQIDIFRNEVFLPSLKLPPDRL